MAEILSYICKFQLYFVSTVWPILMLNIVYQHFLVAATSKLLVVHFTCCTRKLEYLSVISTAKTGRFPVALNIPQLSLSECIYYNQGPRFPETGATSYEVQAIVFKVEASLLCNNLIYIAIDKGLTIYVCFISCNHCM